MSGATAAPAAQLNATPIIIGDYNADQSQRAPSGMTLGGVMSLVIFLVLLGLSALYYLYERYLQRQKNNMQRNSQQQHKGEEPQPQPPPLRPPQPHSPQQQQPTLGRLPTPSLLNPMLGEQAVMRTSLTTTGDQEPMVRLSDNISTLNGILISQHSGPSLLKTSTHPHKLPEPHQTTKATSISSRSSKNSSPASSVSSATSSAIDMHNEV